MGTMYKIFFITLLAGGVVFARSGKNNPREEGKKVKSEHYWVKDCSKGDSNDTLGQKRVHKRRRKIRKPVKGLR